MKSDFKKRSATHPSFFHMLCLVVEEYIGCACVSFAVQQRFYCELRLDCVGVHTCARSSVCKRHVDAHCFSAEDCVQRFDTRAHTRARMHDRRKIQSQFGPFRSHQQP